MLRYRSTLSERSETKGIALLLAAALLSACGGGAHSALVPGGTKSTSSQPGTMTIRFTMPGAPSAATKARMARGRKYVSYSSNGVTIVGAPYPTVPTVPASGATINVGSTNGEAFDVSLTSPNCTVTTSPARICTLSLPVPPGNYNFILTFWDAKPTVSTKAPVGSVLSQSPTVNQAVISGQSNTLGFTFNPEVSSAQLNLSNGVLPYAATSETTNLSIVLKDADGNVIVDDGTGNALLDTTGVALQVNITSTPANSTLTSCGGVAGTATPTITSYVTIPSAADVITYSGDCLYSALLKAVNNATSATIASTTLDISGISQEFALTGFSGTATMYASVLGPDGQIWSFGEDSSGNFVYEPVDPATGTVGTAEISVASHPNAATVGSDGNIWFTTSGTDLEKFSTSSPATVSAFTVTGGDAQMDSIVTGPDGALWFTDIGNGDIFTIQPASVVTSPITPTTGIFAPAPPDPVFSTPADGTSTLPGATYSVQTQYVDATGTEGGSLAVNATIATSNTNDLVIASPPQIPGAAATGWYAYVNGHQMTLADCGTAVPITIGTPCTIKTNPTIAGSGPAVTSTDKIKPLGIIAGPDGNLWVADEFTGELLVVNTSDAIVHRYAVATAQDEPFALVAADSTHVAYAELGPTDKIGIIDTTNGSTADTALTAPYAFIAGPDLALGPNGSIYFTEYNGTTLGAIGQATYSGVTPTVSASNVTAGFTNGREPANLITDDNGGNLWALEFNSATVARFRLP